MKDNLTKKDNLIKKSSHTMKETSAYISAVLFFCIYWIVIFYL